MPFGFNIWPSGSSEHADGTQDISMEDLMSNPWFFLEGNYGKEYLAKNPTCLDRNLSGAIDEQRVQIWDFFFPLSAFEKLFNEGEAKAIKEINESIEKQKSNLERQIKRATYDNDKRRTLIAEMDELDLKKEQDKDQLRLLFSQLRDKIPNPVSKEVVQKFFDEDKEKLQKEATQQVAVGQDLVSVDLFDKNLANQPIKGYLTFISPAELQAPERIPGQYRHLSTNTTKKKILEGLGLTGDSTTAATSLSPKPDLVKHLQAKQNAENEVGNIDIFFGVYHFEYLIVLDYTVIIYSFFYDFILGQIHAVHSTEIYYQDIIAIEYTHEERIIPLSYENDSKVIEIPNIPAIQFLLTGGKTKSILFSNREYFTHQFKHIKSSEQSKKKQIDMIVKRAREEAQAVIKVIRKHIRDQKRTQISSPPKISDK